MEENMSRNHCPSRAFLLLFVFCTSTLPTVAATFNPRDYFLTTTKGLAPGKSSCTASVIADPGTYTRIFQYSAGHCPGVPLFIWHKGAPPWAEEHFFADGNGFIRLLDETGSSSTGYFDRSFTLAEAPGDPGLKVFVDGIVNNYAYISHPGYYHTNWGGNTCPSTWLNVAGPISGFEENVWVGTVSGWLYDCRAGRPCQNGPAYPVEVIQRNGGGTAAGAPVDHFWFARWQDPMDGNQWRGLGFIKFWCTGATGGWCANPGEAHYLVDCQTSPVCYACP